MTIKIGTNWGAKRRHLLTQKLSETTFGTLTWPDSYLTVCGRSITAFDPADEAVPNHISGLDIDGLPWCKACEKYLLPAPSVQDGE